MEDQKKKDEFYMQRALDEARIAYEKGEIPIGAVVVCKDRIISRAHNRHHGCRQYPWGQVSDGLHAIRHRRALYHVCRRHRLGTDTPHRLWGSR